MTVGGGTFLETHDQVREHLRRLQDHHGQYDALLRDIGINPSYFQSLRAEGPRVFVGEQPGTWLPSCETRLSLIRTLMEDPTVEMNRGESGVYTLGNDALSTSGHKASFTTIQPFEEEDVLKHQPVISDAFARKHSLKHAAYSRLEMSGPVSERLETILGHYRKLYEAASKDRPTFLRTMAPERNAPGKQGALLLKNLLANPIETTHLSQLHERLAPYDTERAAQDMSEMIDALRTGTPMNWTQFWNRFNGKQLGTEMREIDPIFNQYLLAVEDPWRVADWVAEQTESYERSQPESSPDLEKKLRYLPLVGIVDDETRKYTMVTFDRAERKMFYSPNVTSEYREITWDEIRELAKQGKTGGPNCFMEYILMAASDLHIVIDNDDSREEKAIKSYKIAEHAHRTTTGRSFPWIVAPPSQPGESSQLTWYNRPELDRLIAEARDRFSGL